MPQPSKKHGETVCCAGVTLDGRWKRLFPIRFRHLSGEKSFGRWNRVEFSYELPKQDLRAESCHVFEDTMVIRERLPEKDRARLLQPLIQHSGKHAAALGNSLALISPRNTRFYWKKRSGIEIADQKDAFRRAALQTSMFDEELAAIEPTPFEFRFKFEDESGIHDYENGDWEAHAMFWRERQRTIETSALKWMDETFNEKYPKRGMLFAIGNQAKRPQTWQLLGVIRLDISAQGELF